MLEKRIESKFVTWCNKNGILQQKLLGRKGMPDRIVYLSRSRVIFIEFKSLRGKLTALQSKQHDILKALDFDVWICRNSEEAIEVIKISLDYV